MFSITCRTKINRKQFSALQALTSPNPYNLVSGNPNYWCYLCTYHVRSCLSACADTIPSASPHRSTYLSHTHTRTHAYGIFTGIIAESTSQFLENWHLNIELFHWWTRCIPLLIKTFQYHLTVFYVEFLHIINGTPCGPWSNWLGLRKAM